MPLVTFESDFYPLHEAIPRVKVGKRDTTITFTPALPIPYSRASIEAFFRAEETRKLGDSNVIGDFGSGGGYVQVQNIVDIIHKTLHLAMPHYIAKNGHELTFREKYNRERWDEYGGDDKLSLSYHSPSQQKAVTVLEILVRSPEKFFPKNGKREGRIFPPTVSSLTLFGLMNLPVYQPPAVKVEPSAVTLGSGIPATRAITRRLLQNREVSAEDLKYFYDNKHDARLSVPILNPTLLRRRKAAETAEQLGEFIQQYHADLANAYGHLLKAEIAVRQGLGVLQGDYEEVKRYHDSFTKRLGAVKFLPNPKELRQNLKLYIREQLHRANDILARLRPNCPKTIVEYVIL